MPEPRTKLIDGESFSITQPYIAGHVINEAEAKALNQTRSENIGNNLRAEIKAKKEKGELDGLAELVAQYDASYTFSMGGGGVSVRKLDPVEREAKALATEYIKADLASKGRTMKQVPEGMTEETWKAKLDDVLESLMARDDILKLAKKRVGEKSKIGEAIGGLLD